MSGKFSEHEVRPVILRNKFDNTVGIVASDLSRYEVMTALCKVSEYLDEPVPPDVKERHLGSIFDRIDKIFELEYEVTARGRALRAVVSDLIDIAYPVELRRDIESWATFTLALSNYMNRDELSLQDVSDIYFQDDREAALRKFKELASIGLAEVVDLMVGNEDICLSLRIVEQIDLGFISNLDEANSIIAQLAEYKNG